VTRFPAAALLLACAAAFTSLAAPAADYRPDLASLPAVPRVDLPAQAVHKALAQPVKERPWQFAVPVDLALSPAQGQWLAAGGASVWRLRLHSEGALSLGLNLAGAVLPAGSTVRVYDPKGQVLLGPYDAAKITATGLWAPAVPGDELVVEIQAPAGTAADVKLGQARVFHGFRDRKAGTGEAAGSCNVDITCPEAASWTQDGASVARIEIGGAYACTGQLLNNVRQDQKRLFLTANHCGVDGDSGPAASVAFYFNYVGACGDGQAQPLPPPTFEGSVRLAHDVQSDFALLLITDSQPLPAGIFFAGWDATGAPTGSGAAIHHPSGGEKKISFFDTPATQSTVNVGSGCPIDAWQVQWRPDGGTTEPGSSGGGLWDAAHRLIGVLSGGSASCSNPSGLDYFARFDRGWTANAAADGQLKAHLDPDGTCVAVVPGVDPVANPNPGAVPATADNRVCEGTASTCTSRHRSSGGSLDGLTLLLLLLGASLSAIPPAALRRSRRPTRPVARA
jgi:hypothetical protein